MAAEQNAENTPLLAEEGKAGETDGKLQEPNDSVSYDARKLVTFDVCSDLAGTVWTKGSLWSMMGILVSIAIMTSVVVAWGVQDPAKLDVAKFQKISGFLKVIVGLLLGFFLTSSVGRWYTCTNGFLGLFDAIRSLHMQLNALGVPKERVYLCMRYCIVSAHCLTISLNASALRPREQRAFCKEQWQKMLTTRNESSVAWSQHGATLAKIYDDELKILENVDDPSQTLWVWVTSLLTRMSADGEIPPMPTPTYGRIIGMAEAAYNGIRDVRASVSVQPPYVHVQMMAMLVSINNIICALSFGMTLGVTVASYLARVKTGVATDLDDTAHDLQDLLITFVLSTIGPFLYQALLEVAVCIAQPFADAGKDPKAPGRIPTGMLLYKLEKDLHDSEKMSANLPWWDQPHFKPPAK